MGLAGSSSRWLLRGDPFEGKQFMLKEIEKVKTEKIEPSQAGKLKPFDPNKASVDEMISLGLPERSANTIVKYRKAGGKFKNAAALDKIYGISKEMLAKLKPFVKIGESGKQKMQTKYEGKSFEKKQIQHEEFDPNTADEASLERNGFPEKSIKILINYREKGGKFRNAEDIKKLYGLSPKFCEEIIPFVKIEKKEMGENRQKSWKKSEEKIEYPLRDLNQIQAQDLTAIRGMDYRTAGRIIKFRDQLGGFANIEQVGETYQINDTILSLVKSRFNIDSSPKRIKINEATQEQLNAHPYIDYKQAKILMSYRKQHGNIKGIEQLSSIYAFTKTFIEKITPYLDFEVPELAVQAASK
ncbi:MAG: helix-hairpin-helix domain-containing protein [Saprospiraceae bacterium]